MNIGFDIPEGARGLVIIPRMKKRPITKKTIESYNDNYPDIQDEHIPQTKANWKGYETSEILGLCSTLGYEVSSVVQQTLTKPNPTFYIGSGKVQEIVEFIDNQEIALDFVVFDCTLKPNQIFSLENTFSVRVMDRNTLILMIFLHHAQTNEAKLQVEYAILKHQIPYVTELVRRAKLGEHPGYLAGGEYKVDEYYRLTKRRIKKIKQNLKKIKTSREQRRKHRRIQGFELVTIAGYTNAGKSALLKLLTDAKVVVDKRMFSTVGTKTRRFRNSNFLFTDTVGFIRNIPPQLIEAFKSTLEEIIYADRIMLVVDISEDLETVLDKIKTSLKTIDQLISETYTMKSDNIQQSTTTNRPIYHLVFNKIDITKDRIKKATHVENELAQEFASHGLKSIFLISCKTKEGLNELIRNSFRSESKK